MIRLSFGQALKKIKKELPQSPRKEKIDQTLATSMDLLNLERNRVGINPKHVEINKSFYRRDDAALSMPRGNPPDAFL